MPTHSQPSKPISWWKSQLLAAAMVVGTAFAGGVASYVATWNIEAQKARLELSRKIEDKFQDEFGKVIILMRGLIVDFSKTKNINEEKRQQTIEAILMLQYYFHKESAVWPASYKKESDELMSSILMFRQQIESANNFEDLDHAFDMIPSILRKKDVIFKDMRSEFQLNLFDVMRQKSADT